MVGQNHHRVNAKRMVGQHLAHGVAQVVNVINEQGSFSFRKVDGEKIGSAQHLARR